MLTGRNDAADVFATPVSSNSTTIVDVVTATSAVMPALDRLDTAVFVVCKTASYVARTALW
jgi:hypothetical protein